MEPAWKKYLSLFTTFFRIGAFTFGGGYAMIPLIQREAVEKHKWVSDDDILEIIAIAESTPGPISINAATFVGYRVGGVLGSLCCTFGVVFPPFVIILAISGILRQFQDNPYVQYAFFGIRAGVLALIVKALWGMFKKCDKTPLAYGVILGVFLAVILLDLPVVCVLIAAALVGLAVTLALRRKSK